MASVWKLSPSDLTFLWNDCKRCFYNKVVYRVAQPSKPMATIFNSIDALINTFFRGRPTCDICSDLPSGKVVSKQQYVTSQHIQLPNHDGKCYIKGRFDSLFRFDDGTYGVVDFKTSQPKPDHVEFYRRQLQAYAYALEHPAPGTEVRIVTRLGLACFEPQNMEWLRSGCLAYTGRITWLECENDEMQFLRFIDQVLTVIEAPSAPSCGSQCGWCGYREWARTTGV